MLDVAMLLLTPLIQIGASYYVSVAILLSVAEIVRWFRPLISGLQWALPAIVLFAVILMTNVAQFTGSWGSDLLRAGREGLIFVLLVAGIREFTRRPPIADPTRLLNVIAGILSGLLVLCLAQRIFYQSGVYFGIPVDYFAVESKTLPTEAAFEAALTYGGRFGGLRPNATFREPSYLAFVLISFAIMVVPLMGTMRKARWMLAMIFVTGAVSHSVAFIAAFLLVVIVPAMANRRHAVTLASGGLALVVLGPLLGLDILGYLLDRFSGTGGLQADLSTEARIVVPFQVLAGFIVEHPFGVAVSRFEDALIPLMPGGMVPSEIAHNGLFNALFLYGLPGAAMLIVYLRSAGTLPLGLYLLTSANFNGALFAPDKFAMILLAVAVSESMRRAAAARQ
ncbi:hypothetical protein [Prosthecodimorpha staleyi]|uniref:O-antigen ligase domain-containing protein n=1 Tax=Prosthecodimorpha staleyi TaxID=2840188 RepID=A0A947GBA5_9HYPH|nr:hypothetical protein [Prosthecodimorpha staleyi]MBT9288467.1 hypothetical protein [Prosthecodimorpha staleyi]